MGDDQPDATRFDATAVLDATQGELPPVEAVRDVLVLAWSDAQARGPEVLPLPSRGVVLGRGMAGFPGGKLLDPRMSREHARVYRERGRWVIDDLGSRNGTRIEGRILEGGRNARAWHGPAPRGQPLCLRRVQGGPLGRAP